MKQLDKVALTGGQDNLQSVVKAAELAGEAKGGTVLWIHGPQPSFNEEIYIMAPYIATPEVLRTCSGQRCYGRSRVL